MRRSKKTLLDHLICELSEPHRHIQAECLGGFEVNHELKLGRLHHWQVGGLCALKDASCVDADLASFLHTKIV